MHITWSRPTHMFRSYNNSQTTNRDLIVVLVRRIRVIEWALPDDKLQHTHIYSNTSKYEINCALKMLKLIFRFLPTLQEEISVCPSARVRLLDSRSFRVNMHAEIILSVFTISSKHLGSRDVCCLQLTVLFLLLIQNTTPRAFRTNIPN
jgi:hypothetical protein